MSLADILIIIGLVIIFGLIIRMYWKEHKRGIPLDCVSCPFIEQIDHDHNSCSHHNEFSQLTICKIKNELHQEFKEQ